GEILERIAHRSAQKGLRVFRTLDEDVRIPVDPDPGPDHQVPKTALIRAGYGFHGDILEPRIRGKAPHELGSIACVERATFDAYRSVLLSEGQEPKPPCIPR